MLIWILIKDRGLFVWRLRMIDMLIWMDIDKYFDRIVCREDVTC